MNGILLLDTILVTIVRSSVVRISDSTEHSRSFVKRLAVVLARLSLCIKSIYNTEEIDCVDCEVTQYQLTKL